MTPDSSSVRPAGIAQDRNSRFSLLGPLLLLFALTIWLVSPRGAFPLNDDWVYAKSVKWLLEEGRFAVHPYAAANAAGQIVIGTVFTAPFGFNFTALRISTLCIALVGAWAAARTGREIGLGRGMALLIGAMILWNPISLNLSYTFMTDVPFAAFAAVSQWFFVRAILRGRVQDVFWGSAVAAYAFYIRQFSVVLPLAYGLTVWWAVGHRSLRHHVALVAPWAVAGLFWVLWKRFGDTGYVWPEGPEGLSPILRTVRFVFMSLRYPFVAGMYMGLFLLPLGCVKAWSHLSGREQWTRGQRWLFIAFCAGGMLFGTGLGRKPMPLLRNMLRDLGVGPLTLQDSYFTHRAWAPVHASPVVWWVITGLALVSGGLLIADLWGRVIGPALARRRETAQAATPLVFLTLSGLFLLAAPCNPWLPAVYDRYLIPGAIPLGLVLACGIRATRGARIAAGLCAAAFYVFGIVCLQDYFAWNRARWEAVDTLHKTYGASDLQIDGGYEFNGMHTSDEYMRRTGSRDFNDTGKNRWWVFDPLYAVSFLPRPDYEVVDGAAYFSWLEMRERELRILRRKPGEAVGQAAE